MSSLREVEDLVSELIDEVEDHMEAESLDPQEQGVQSDMTESERARFIHDWAERLRAACSSAETLIRPPPLNGGGLFVRED